MRTVAFEASEDRTSVLREVLSAREPEPTAESSVPTSSSFSCAYQNSRQPVTKKRTTKYKTINSLLSTAVDDNKLMKLNELKRKITDYSMPRFYYSMNYLRPQIKKAIKNKVCMQESKYNKINYFNYESAKRHCLQMTQAKKNYIIFHVKNMKLILKDTWVELEKQTSGLPASSAGTVNRTSPAP